MAFNFGAGNRGVAASAAYNAYYYDEVVYRRYITRIAIDFYTGRQDSYVWFDLQKQFRHPDKMQILPYNITREIIDETSILYREKPNYIVKDSEGKTLKDDTKLWKKIMKSSRYHNLCLELDAMTKLLGTVLVKVSIVDPDTGDLVNETKPGMAQFDIVYGGNYNVSWANSPYYINELDFEFGDTVGTNKTNKMFGGTVPTNSSLSVASVPTDTTKIDREHQTESIKDLGKITKVKWSLKNHEAEDEDGKSYSGENPYGCIPAIPFFNQDPGDRFFLPINEPLIYANHAINMRLTDLNHIAKYQSFGQAVVKGIERPVNNRMGRPIDDFNSRSGSRSFGLGGGSDIGPTGLDRNTFSGFEQFQDGNAQANQNGFSLGPDTMVSVGETGDFKFVSPQANISGLVQTIYTMMDMTRKNYGLTGKHEQKTPSSGAAIQFEKLGVVEINKKRSMLFKEREEQLFQIVKKLWNVHYEDSGEELFSDDCELEVHYVDPEFATDPMTRMTALQQELELLQSGNKHILQKLYPHLDEEAIEELLEDHHEHSMVQATRDTEIENHKFENSSEVQSGLEASKMEAENKHKVDMAKANGQQQATPKAKPGTPRHSAQSSIQPGKNGDPRVSDKEKRRRDQAEKEK